MPALVIVGDADAITPPSVAESMQQKISGAKLEVIRGAGSHVADGTARAGQSSDRAVFVVSLIRFSAGESRVVLRPVFRHFNDRVGDDPAYRSCRARADVRNVLPSTAECLVQRDEVGSRSSVRFERVHLPKRTGPAGRPGGGARRGSRSGRAHIAASTPRPIDDSHRLPFSAKRAAVAPSNMR